MAPGDKAKITKRTFLHKGIFIFTGAVVQVLSLEGEQVRVLYNDREGHPHEIDFLLSDLEKLEG